MADAAGAPRQMICSVTPNLPVTTPRDETYSRNLIRSPLHDDASGFGCHCKRNGSNCSLTATAVAPLLVELWRRAYYETHSRGRAIDQERFEFQSLIRGMAQT